MASSPDLKLISRILRDGNLREVREFGLTHEDFRTTEGKTMFKELVAYNESFETRGAVPGMDMFPNFILSDSPGENFTSLCYEVRKNRLIVEAASFADDLLNGLEKNPEDALLMMRKRLDSLIELGVRRSNDLNFVEQGLQGVCEAYEKIAAGGFSCKVEWPWVPMNEITGGIQEDDFIIFYGRPKNMKSWVICFLIAELFFSGYSVLVYTKEMTAHNISKRVAACLGRFAYQELRLGKLSDANRDQLFSMRESLMSGHFHRKVADRTSDLIILSDKDAKGDGSIPWIGSKIDKYKPDIVFIDGLYLLKVSGGKQMKDHERVMNVSREARQLVLDTSTPIIATMQANRKAAQHNAAELDEIAYSDAIGQDATMAFRCIADRKQPLISLVTGGSREFELPGFRIHGEPASNFGFHSIMDEKDIQKAVDKDVTDDEAENKSKPRRIREKTATDHNVNKTLNDAVKKHGLDGVIA